MADIRLSPSKINLFMECERCFWLKEKRDVRRPSGPFPSLPSGMDEIIKQHFDRFRGDGEVPPELAAADIDARPHPDEELLAKARKWQVEPWYEDPETGVLVKGAVDDLLVDDDGDIVVLDYKTRGYPPKDEVPGYYARQVNLYNLILRQNGHDTADHGLLLYYYPERVQDDGDVVFETEFHEVTVDLAAAQDLVRDAVGTLHGPEPEPSDDCDFCRYHLDSHG
ncbi:MAG: PD-(D/E)XK nuclease family protein [Candidatus Nanohaloarchaea archaeon]